MKRNRSDSVTVASHESRPGGDGAESTSEVRLPRTCRLGRVHDQRRFLPRGWHARGALGVIVLVVTATSPGCGRSSPDRVEVFPVSGKLLFEGKPAAGAWVFLHPQNEEIAARPKGAVVDDDGTFAVGTYELDDGAPAGNYKVTVEWRRPIGGASTSDQDEVPPNVLPSAYANPATTPVRVTVEAGENEIPPIAIPN